MSDMEFKAGKATLLDIPEGLNFAETIGHLVLLGHEFNDLEITEEWFDSDTVVHVDGKWFSLEPYAMDADFESFVTHHDNKSFTYICHWYNGGGSFNEVFEDALKKYPAPE